MTLWLGLVQVFEEVEVGKGRRAYRFATQCLQTHKALDALQDMRFYTSEVRRTCCPLAEAERMS